MQFISTTSHVKIVNYEILKTASLLIKKFAVFYTKNAFIEV